jgi:hypothetical protein
MGEAEKELRDVPGRIARERVPTIEATSSVRASNKGFSYTNLPPDSTGNRGSTC